MHKRYKKDHHSTQQEHTTKHNTHHMVQGAPIRLVGGGGVVPVSPDRIRNLGGRCQVQFICDYICIHDTPNSFSESRMDREGDHKVSILFWV